MKEIKNCDRNKKITTKLYRIYLKKKKTNLKIWKVVENHKYVRKYFYYLECRSQIQNQNILTNGRERNVVQSYEIYSPVYCQH